MTPGTYRDGPMKLVVGTKDEALLHYEKLRCGLNARTARALLKQYEPLMPAKWQWVIQHGPLIMPLRDVKSLVRVLRMACTPARKAEPPRKPEKQRRARPSVSVKARRGRS